MKMRQFLQIPGPTNIPDRIRRQLSKPLINHRGPEFEKLLSGCIDDMKKVLKTDNDLLIFPSSGSGALESVVVNLFSEGDTIVVPSLGIFSERLAIIGENFGLNVIRIKKEWGKALKMEDVEEILHKDKNKEIKALCLPQIETSTGVVNNIKEISQVMKEVNHSALLVVDGISSIACMPMEVDSWNVDVLISASQKGFMLPPGMAFVTLSKAAWEYVEGSSISKWYWDFKSVKERMESLKFPYTPATTNIFGLRESLNMILEEGLENLYERHRINAKVVRNSIRAIGLKVLSEEIDSSNVVTAVNLPKDIGYEELAGLLRCKYNVEIGGGLGGLKDKIFRIGHMGYLHITEIHAIMSSIEMVLYELGYRLDLGTVAKSISETYLNI